MRYLGLFVLVGLVALLAGSGLVAAQPLVVTATPGNLPVVIPPGSTSAVDDILNNPGVLTPNPTRVFPADAPPGLLQPGTPARVTVATLNVRSEPITGRNNVITQLGQGQDVRVISLSNDSQWALIDTGGPAFTQGWVAAVYLLAYEENFFPFEATSVPLTGGTGFLLVAQNTVNIRAFPTIFSPRVGLLPIGTEAQIVGRKGNYFWWKIQMADGTVGWVAREYVYVPDPLAFSQVPEVIE